MGLLLRITVFALASIAPLAMAQESKGFWSRSLTAVNRTTPFVLGDKEQQDRGWFRGTWDGTKRIWREGEWDVYLSGYTWHLPYAYTTEERKEENAFTYGLGLGKTLTDERDNQRSLYALIIEDSNYKTQFSLGYTWMARWRTIDDLKLGLGYSVFLFAREDFNNYVPQPGIAPLLSFGTDKVSVWATFVPGEASILYFFGRVSFDKK
jgi:lipid IVA palmitoyltransferase